MNPQNSTIWKPYYMCKGVEVSQNGLIRKNYKLYAIVPDYRFLHMYEDHNSKRKYVNIGGTKHYVDIMVAKCFCYNPGKKRYIQHKDGDIANNNASNLEWVDRCTYRQLNRQSLTKTYKGEPFLWYTEDIFISEKGKVLVNNAIQHISHTMIDSDTNVEHEIGDFIGYDGHKIFIDEMMCEVWQKQIIHKDGDFTNWNESNIDAVDWDSLAAQEERKRRSDWQNKENLRYRTIAMTQP